MRHHHSTILWSALALGVSMGANAADMPPIFEQRPAVVQEFGSGWYLRGDIGYRFNNVPSVELSNAVALTGANIGDSFTAGGGVGYKHTWLRADLTVDYGFLTNFTASSAVSSPYIWSKFDTVVGLANAYLDLGTWSRFTPYIGAGAGAALVHISRYQSVVDATDSPSQKVNFAWAVMAGLGYSVSPNLVIDAGYRYVDLGSVRSGNPPLGPSAVFDRLTGHEARLGFRYTVD